MSSTGPSPDEVVRRRRRRSTRDARPAALLGVLGVLLGLAWLLTGPAVDVATAPPTGATAVATPLLSARRVPVWLTAEAGARALAAELGPALRSLPPESCLVLRAGGSDLVSVRGDRSVIPASNLKPLTATAAIELLGPDTRLATVVLAPPEPDGRPVGTAGVVDGDLVLVGGGDPVLTTSGYQPYEGLPRTLLTPLELLAERVAATGIATVSGSVVGDESRYDTVRGAPGWRPGYVTDAQVSRLSALVVDDGRPAAADSDPALLAAATFTRLLEERGVQVAGPPRVGVAPPGDVEVARVESPTVRELAEELVRFSDNTTAELLVKEVGRQRRGEGTTAAGTAEVLAWAARDGLPLDGATVVDGSGLSRDNRLSCDAMVAVLERSGPDGELSSWLARPGRPGTLDDRMLGTGLEDRVRAKTGSLDGVRSLAGWLSTAAGRDVAFAVAANADGVSESDLERLEEGLLSGTVGYPEVPPLESLRPLPARTT